MCFAFAGLLAFLLARFALDGFVAGLAVFVTCAFAAATFGWERYAKSVLGIDHYGASAPYKIIFEKFGLTVENIVTKAKELI